jgi:hypothetical protein
MTVLGISLAITFACAVYKQVVYAPLRKVTLKHTDIFKQTQQTVTYKHSTTLTNTKDVPVTVALVDTVPHCSELLVQVRYIYTRHTLQSTNTLQYALRTSKH